jgi:hypothetical protein
VVPVCWLFADNGETGWLRYFAGAPAVRSIFPTAARTAELFVEYGIEVAGSAALDAAANTEITNRLELLAFGKPS